MTQPNVAFIACRAPRGQSLEAVLLEQAERFVRLGRRNVFLIVDALDLEGAVVSAMARLAYRVAELNASLTCVVLNDRAMASIRAHPALESLRLIQRVDQIRDVA